MLKPGVRVVRGPNWSWENQDGGEGYAGTVSQVGTCESDKTAIIQWDNGSRTVCRVGYLDKYDLRVIDNAQIGVSHKRVICDVCNAHDICGMRYKCNNCYDFDLCSICYHGDKHDLTHSFKRIESDKSSGINLPPRLNGTKCELKGIFKGATVIRGADWEWGNQDGGKGKCGIVKDIRGWGKKSARSTAYVKWLSANTEIYRVGHKGYCDIQFVEATSAGCYYPEHLPVLGQSEEQMEMNQIIDIIELQQVKELENREKTASLSKVEQPKQTARKNPISPQLGSVEAAYTSVLINYKDSIAKGKVDLVDVFSRLSNEFGDETVTDMWEILKYMTTLPTFSAKDDIIQTRNSESFVMKSVEQGKRYLENKFKNYMTDVVNEHEADDSQVMVETTYDLVHRFVGLRFQGEYSGLENEVLDNRPLWPMVYYCFRAGDLVAASTCLAIMLQPEFQDIIDLLSYKGGNQHEAKVQGLEETMKRSYKYVRNSTDPFKRIVWAVLGRCDEISEVARTVDDYLWFKLSQVRVDDESDNFKHQYLQYAILEEQGENHYDAFNRPLMYFKLLALTGQFEAAIDFLYRTDKYKVHAAHMAIALNELYLLARPRDLNAPLVSIDPTDRKPARRLNFPLLLNSYVSKFEGDCLNETLHYLFLLRKRNQSVDEPDLFESAVYDLIRRTKEYEKILGRVQRDGARTLGLLDQFTVANDFTNNLARTLVSKEQLDEAIELFDGVNLHNGILWVLCKMLAQVVHLGNEPGSLRNKFEEKAVLFDERFSRENCCNADLNMINCFIKLKGLFAFFDLYRGKQYPEALKALNELKIVPLRFEEVEHRVKSFASFNGDLSKVMPYVLLATMTILKAQCVKIKSTDGPMDEHLQCVWSQANCITNFAERLGEVITGDTMNVLLQMELSLHT